MNTSILPYRGQQKTIVKDHNTDDIVREVLTAHKVFAKDYDLIAPQFWRGNQLDTIRYIFNYCKKNFPYKVEGEESQTTRSPGAIIATAKKMGVDCKHYAGWIAGVLDALNRTGKNFTYKYRFASYDLFNSTPEHFFIVVTIGGNEYWVYPVLQQFDQRTPGYIYSFDKKPAMQRIGISTAQELLLKNSGIIPRTDLVLNENVQPGSTTAPPAQNDSFAKYLPLLLIGGVLLYYATKKRRRK